MKLPEINQSALDAVCSAQPIDLAQLHCLRSIAVNLEVIAGIMQLQEGAEVSPEIANTIKAALDFHSVGE